jgi:hypothetical protein
MRPKRYVSIDTTVPGASRRLPIWDMRHTTLDTPCTIHHTPYTIYLGNWTQHALTVASAGIEDGETFANATKELERNRKQHEIQFAEFEIIKKSLTKDLLNRCEKVGPVDCADGGLTNTRWWSSRCSSTKSGSSTRLSPVLRIHVRNSGNWSFWNIIWMPSIVYKSR